MKRVLVASLLPLFVLRSVTVFADVPIYRGFWWDSLPAAAYNAKDMRFWSSGTFLSPFTLRVT